jgi:alpha-1,6-mannosyltransferase
MKIAHIANFYSENSGGIKTTISQLGIGYGGRGHDFFFIVPGVRYEIQSTAHGTRISLPSVPIPLSGGYRIIRSNRELRKVLSIINPHHIEVSDRLTLRKIGTWARRRKISCVVFSHESLDALVRRFLKAEFLLKYVNRHNRKLAQSFDFVIASTEFAAREFRRIITPNLKKISLGVNLETFQPMRRDEELRKSLLGEADVLIVHGGRLSIEKNPEQSLKVLRAVRARGINAKLIYVGMGPLFHKLKSRSKNDEVEFLGYIAGPTKFASILASADIALAPGPHETFCLTALEALACGTPVLASDQSAVTEILSNDAGLPVGFTCSDNPEEWARNIQRVLADQGIRMRARTRAEEFSWNKTIQSLLSIPEEIQIERAKAA